MSQTQTSRAIRLLTLLALLSQAWATWAEPSQNPLINRPGSQPRPNVMLTLDDSGSMTYQYLPERPFDFKYGTNTAVVKFPNDAKVYLHPEELRKNIFSPFFRSAKTETKKETATAIDTTFVSATLTDDEFALSDPPGGNNAYSILKIYQVQMRSPQMNTIYYNPAIRYTPWETASGDRYKEPTTKTAVPLDPLSLYPDTPKRTGDKPIATTVIKDTVDLTATTTKTAKWYCGPISGKDASGTYNYCTDKKLSFNPAIFYLHNANTDPNNAKNYVLYNLNDGQKDSDKTVYTYSKDRTDCAASAWSDDTKTTPTKMECARSADWQNFINWFVFYRSRLMIAQHVIPAAFNASSENVRIGWGTIHTGIAYDKTGEPIESTDPEKVSVPTDPSQKVNIHGHETQTSIKQGVQNWTSAQKDIFTKWMRQLKTYRLTPSKEALSHVGAYFQRSDEGGPWSADPSTGTIKPSLGCRRAYNILLTDGYTSDVTNVGNVDGAAAAPFKDAVDNTLADIAMKFWLTDLSKPSPSNSNGLPDEVRPITVAPTETISTELAKYKSNPATWQHLTQMMIGFGVSGNIVTKSNVENDALLERLGQCGTNGTSPLCWTGANEIDDLWHAAINSRGSYFSANNPEELKTSLKEALNLASTSSFKEAGLATASATLSASNFKYVPSYKPMTWTGDLVAYELDNKGVAGALAWSANEQLVKSGAPRHVFINDRDASTTSAQNVVRLNTYDALSERTQAALGKNAARVDYLLGKDGDATVRQRNSEKQTTSKGEEVLKQLLPDFINSLPLFVKNGIDAGYATTESSSDGKATYAAYLTDKKDRKKGLLFVGGNGGMLHAFDATSGSEAFAFIPSAAIPKISTLTQPDYGLSGSGNYHQYVVDGPLMESDVYLKSNSDSADADGGSWTNIVVGTMGAGGQSVFALKLDAKDPIGNLGASSVLWEKTSVQATDMGYITSEPQVGRLPDGTWKVFIGNGFDSATGNATLITIDVASGDVSQTQAYTQVKPGGTAAQTAPNGLGGVTLVKDSKTGNVTAAYAGDKLGKLWRFDVSTVGNISTVSVGLQDKKPLFVTQANQPIVAAPSVWSHPKGGQLVVINTGSLSYEADVTDHTPQSAYGIWDKQSALLPSSAAFETVTRSQLFKHTINNRTNPTDSTKPFFDLADAEKTALDWATNMGWYLDLAIPAATVKGLPTYPKAIRTPISLKRSVVITAIQPSANEESCTESKSVGYAFLLNALTGAAYTVPVLDTNGDGKIDNDDVTVGGYQSDTVPVGFLRGETGTGTPCKKGSDAFSLQSATGDQFGCEPPGAGNTIKDRVWRQLLNPPHP
ncbi:MAG: PilC/PilY family type IV pilus protein [Aquabacterium sp.]|nr:PilC/PilY family type IV pilus protein [Aquabacterium sp.]